MNDPLNWFCAYQPSIDMKERKKFFRSACLQPEDSGNIADLPDEKILIIFNKLNKTDLLYSFSNVNRRFDKLYVKRFLCVLLS